MISVSRLAIVLMGVALQFGCKTGESAHHDTEKNFGLTVPGEPGSSPPSPTPYSCDVPDPVTGPDPTVDWAGQAGDIGNYIYIANDPTGSTQADGGTGFGLSTAVAADGPVKECKSCPNGVTYRCFDEVPGGATAACNQDTCSIALSKASCKLLGIKDGDKGDANKDRDPGKRPPVPKGLSPQDTLDFMRAQCDIKHEAEHACQDKPSANNPGCKLEQPAYDVGKQCLLGYFEDGCKGTKLFTTEQCSLLVLDIFQATISSEMMACHCRSGNDTVLNRCASCGAECSLRVQNTNLPKAYKDILDQTCLLVTKNYCRSKIQFPPGVKPD